MAKNRRRAKQGAPQQDDGQVDEVSNVVTDELEGQEQEQDSDPTGSSEPVSEAGVEVTDAPTPGTKVRKIKDVMYEQIVEKKETDTKVILDAIYLEFPDANSGPKDISWYRWKFRRDGHEVEGGRGEKLTDEERKAKKVEYEAKRKAKLDKDKADRRQAAQQAALEAEQQKIAALTDQAIDALMESGEEVTGLAIKAKVQELLAAGV